MAEFIEFIDTEGREIAFNATMIQHIRYHSSSVTEITLKNGDCYWIRMPYGKALDLIDKAASGGTEQG